MVDGRWSRSIYCVDKSEVIHSSLPLNLQSKGTSPSALIYSAHMSAKKYSADMTRQLPWGLFTYNVHTEGREVGPKEDVVSEVAWI